LSLLRSRFDLWLSASIQSSVRLKRDYHSTPWTGSLTAAFITSPSRPRLSYFFIRNAIIHNDGREEV
jgi:hypothetical protein